MKTPTPILLAASLVLLALPSRADLLAYYPLDETTGNMAFDLSGNGFNATAGVANSNWQPSLFGGGVMFTPTPGLPTDVDESFLFIHTADLATNYPMTLSAWINTTFDQTPDNRQTFLMFGTQITNSRYYAMALGATSNQLEAQARNTTQINALSPNPVNDGLWHSAVFVLNSPTDRILYLDGVAVASSTTSVTALPAANQPRRISFGALNRVSSPTDAFTGMMDEVGIWTDALSAERIALVHGFGRFDGVTLDEDDTFNLALSVFQTQSGSVDTGLYEWQYASGLSGGLGFAGTDGGGNPFIVLDNSGNGLAVVPEPGSAGLLLLGSLFGVLRRRRRP